MQRSLYFISFKPGSKSYVNMSQRLVLLSSDESPLEGILDDGTDVFRLLLEGIVFIEDIEVYSIPAKYQEDPSEFEIDYMESNVPMTKLWPKNK